MKKKEYKEIDHTLSLEDRIICTYLRGSIPFITCKYVTIVDIGDMIVLPKKEESIYKIKNIKDLTENTKELILQNMQYPKKEIRLQISSKTKFQKVIGIQNFLGGDYYE